ANEGVLIETGGKKILVDALFREPNPAYAAPPKEVLEKLETAQPPFDDVDLILATHNHGDHFDARSVVRHLRHNPRAVFLAEALEKKVID
ncbi:MAG: MBL fold metallo-hydrolase, partial [bacterium]|nr:MBL fold metallo-hydrolase [bacterium]